MAGRKPTAPPAASPLAGTLSLAARRQSYSVEETASLIAGLDPSNHNNIFHPTYKQAEQLIREAIDRHDLEPTTRSMYMNLMMIARDDLDRWLKSGVSPGGIEELLAAISAGSSQPERTEDGLKAQVSYETLLRIIAGLVELLMESDAVTRKQRYPTQKIVQAALVENAAGEAIAFSTLQKVFAAAKKTVSEGRGARLPE